MHAGSIVLTVAMLAACRSHPKAPATPASAATTPEGNDFLAGCTCEQLNAPIKAPTDAAELARWQRAGTALDAVFADLAPLTPSSPCPPTINDDVTRVLGAHADAIRESRALDAASCDHFSRWHHERTDKAATAAVLEASLSGCLQLSGEPAKQLNGLLISRGCTAVSSND